MIVKINHQPIEVDLSKIQDVVSLPFETFDAIVRTPIDVHLTYNAKHLFLGDINPINAVFKFKDDVFEVATRVIDHICF